MLLYILQTELNKQSPAMILTSAPPVAQHVCLTKTLLLYSFLPSAVMFDPRQNTPWTSRSLLYEKTRQKGTALSAQALLFIDCVNNVFRGKVTSRRGFWSTPPLGGMTRRRSDYESRNDPPDASERFPSLPEPLASTEWSNNLYFSFSESR